MSGKRIDSILNLLHWSTTIPKGTSNVKKLEQAIERSTNLASDELDRLSRMQAPEATSFYPAARLLEAYARGC